MQRRDVLKMGAIVAAVGCLRGGGARTLLRGADLENAAPVKPIEERMCLFTDHLDDFGYSYAEVAEMLAPLKIAGPDLTVRAGGVVPPERVADELPKAAAAFKDRGMSIPMISTNLTTARDPNARPTLTTMQKLGIRYFKLGYYHYGDLAGWEADLTAARKDLAGLLELGREFGVHAGFHNHAGAIGGALWDSWELLQPLDRAAVGFYFDPSHASVEGAKETWKLNLQRLSPRLSMVAIKDYLWEKTSKGWQTRWCPLGEGMVDWPEVFRRLVRFPFPGPLSVHIEYDPGGSTRVERIENSLAAAQRDLAFVRKHLAEARGAK
jgi:sugar phosphate isomerase/epimerase